MPSVRDVHDAFERMIARQKKVVQMLQAERQETRTQKSAADRQLEIDLAPVIPDVSEQTLAVLTRAMSKIWAGTKTPPERAADTTRNDAALRAQIEARTQEWGDSPARAAQIKLAGTMKREAEEKEDEAQLAVNALVEHLAPVTRLNAASNPKIIRENSDYFQQFNFWKFVGNGDYRRGYQIVRDYSRAGHDVFNDQDSLKSAEVVLENAATEVQDTKNLINVLNGREAEIENLTRGITGDAGVLKQLRADVKALLLGNEGFASDLAKEIPAHFARPVMLGVLKIRNLEKIETGLDQGVKNILKTTGNLEAPMSKLAKGRRYQPSKSVNVDLAKIEKTIDAQAAVGTYRGVSASRAREAVRDFTPSKTSSASSDDMAAFNTMFILYLLSADADPAYVRATFDIDQETANAANLDLSNITPDIAGALGSDMDHVRNSLSHIDPVSLSNIDVGSIDVGHIDTGSSHNDYSGGSSHDSGSSNFD